MRIDSIKDLAAKCTGCMACVDVCPKGCISSFTGEDGFVYSRIDESSCVDCSLCYNVCPLDTQKKHQDEQKLFAAYAKERAVRNGGSSGGMFELLARYCLANGFAVCGAAFDGTTLRHKIVEDVSALSLLLKSKYLQSDTEGIYKQISSLLTDGKKVFFCGTPCQVSALLNFVPERLRENLLTADIICHGVPSQSVFSRYIESLSKKHGSPVSRFSFRVKDNRYRHAHGYSFDFCKNGKVKTVNGIYTDSSFYNAFKKYCIFREGCYDCRYTTLERVSDLTLGDFWGIEKYDFCGNADTGVSMIITNTKKGEEFFGAVKDETVWKEFPVQYGVDSNHCLTHRTVKPANRDAIVKALSQQDYDAVAQKHFGSRLIERIYWCVPPFARNLLRKLRRG